MYIYRCNESISSLKRYIGAINHHISGLKKINAKPEYPFSLKSILYIVNILSYDGVRSKIFMLNLMN